MLREGMNENGLGGESSRRKGSQRGKEEVLSLGYGAETAVREERKM